MDNDGSWRDIRSHGKRNIQARAVGQNYSKTAADIRNKFCDYFHRLGAVGWQDNRYTFIYIVLYSYSFYSYISFYIVLYSFVYKYVI